MHNDMHTHVSSSYIFCLLMQIVLLGNNAGVTRYNMHILVYTYICMCIACNVAVCLSGCVSVCLCEQCQYITFPELVNPSLSFLSLSAIFFIVLLLLSAHLTSNFFDVFGFLV